MPIKDLRVNLEPEEQEPDIKAKKRVLSRVLQGNWNTFLKGQGIEFAGFRSYTFEDDASQIDWKASLRSDKTLVREYEEYKTLNVYVMLDVSDTMLFSSHEKLKAEHGAELTFALCDAIQKAGDAVGMGMFTDELVTNIPPSIGQGFVPRMKKELKNANNYGGPSGIKKVLQHINASVKQPALFIVISDFIGAEEGWERYLTILAQKMDIMGIMLRDPRDKDFPAIGGQFVLEHPTEGHSQLVDIKDLGAKYSEYVQEQEERIRNAFSRVNAGLLRLSTAEDMYDPLLKFLNRRSNIVER